MDKTVVVIDDSPIKEDRVEIAYAYPDVRAHAPSPIFAQIWLLNEGAGDRLLEPGDQVVKTDRDVIVIDDPKNPECGAKHTVPPGWLWRTLQPRSVKIQQKVTRVT